MDFSTSFLIAARRLTPLLPPEGRIDNSLAFQFQGWVSRFHNDISPEGRAEYGYVLRQFLLIRRAMPPGLNSAVLSGLPQGFGGSQPNLERLGYGQLSLREKALRIKRVQSPFGLLCPCSSPSPIFRDSIALLSFIFFIGLSCAKADTPIANPSSPPAYTNNFENAEPGKVPDDFMVLEGGFVVKEENGNKFLELPGAPLDSFAVLFGPAANSNVVVSARINSTAKGRRFPTFGVGLGGVAGYRLQISPAKGLLELYRDQTVKTTAPFQWKPGDWLTLRLQLRSEKAGGWKIEGKVWAAGAPEPGQWMITFTDAESPPPGRASLFASPFSGVPIRFDDVAVNASSNQ